MADEIQEKFYKISLEEILTVVDNLPVSGRLKREVAKKGEYGRRFIIALSRNDGMIEIPDEMALVLYNTHQRDCGLKEVKSTKEKEIHAYAFNITKFRDGTIVKEKELYIIADKKVLRCEEFSSDSIFFELLSKYITSYIKEKPYSFLNPKP